MFPPLGYPPLWSHPRSPSVISALISLLSNHDRYCMLVVSGRGGASWLQVGGAVPAGGEWEGQWQLVVSGRGSASWS